MNFGQFPERRMRRLRRTAFLRDMVRESSLSAADFIYPVFILDGKNQRQSVSSMPGFSGFADASS
jgi:porphobilinogen synthase